MVRLSIAEVDAFCAEVVAATARYGTVLVYYSPRGVFRFCPPGSAAAEQADHDERTIGTYGPGAQAGEIYTDCLYYLSKCPSMICTDCGQQKKPAHMHIKAGRITRRCRQCDAARQRKYRQLRRGPVPASYQWISAWLALGLPTSTRSHRGVRYVHRMGELDG